MLFYFLTHYDPDKPLVLACEPSPWGLGAVLLQRFSDGMEKPIVGPWHQQRGSTSNWIRRLWLSFLG